MTFAEFIEKYNLRLSKQQQAAVISITGPTLLLAVPGGGKTHVLVTRLGYMIIAQNIPAEDILVLTYTTSATKDMRDRFIHYFGEEHAENLEFRTLNGICQKIYNYCAYHFKRKPFDLVEDSTQIVSSCIKKVTEQFPDETTVRDVKQAIGYIKNMMLQGEDLENFCHKYSLPLKDIYDSYNQYLWENGLMDYDDQMLYAHMFLTRYPKILEKYQHEYKYICVDEAQDTSKIQHEIIKLLAADNENLFLVGDEDQSIYGFRAAYPHALLEFEDDHENAEVLLMEDNYRSNGKIVEIADKFIQKNTLRHKKKMMATRPHANDVKEIPILSRSEQYSRLFKVASECTTQTAIMYRDNESALPLINLFEKNNIPYRLVGASKEFLFFSHPSITDIKNIILFSMDLDNVDLFKQIYYKMNLYLKKEEVQNILKICKKEELSLFDGIIYYLKNSLHDIDRANSIILTRETLLSLRKLSASVALSRIRNDLGYDKYLHRAKMTDSKVEILSELAEKEVSPLSLLQRLEDLSALVKDKEPDYSAKVLLSTFHSSKGLEFDDVYLIDVTDGIFPKTYYDEREMKIIPRDELATYEEERRLFYVAMTRAKNNLSIFSMNSSFCKEIFGNKNFEAFIRKMFDSKKEPELKFAKPAPKKMDRKEYNEFCESLTEGKIVKHKSFGRGIVSINEGKYVTITFDQAGPKTLSTEVLYKNDLII